jgi:glycosyltransferase involved in cell wall biosynthesis
MNQKAINVMQFICPVGFYGAERWILALVNNSNPELVRHDLVVTDESPGQDLEILTQFPKGSGKTHRLSMTSRFDWSVVNKLCEIIRSRKIDIIHTHGYKSDFLGFFAARKCGIRCLSTPHGFGKPTDLKLKLFIWLGGRMLRFFDCVAPLSQQLFDEVLAYGVKQEKVVYIQNAVDISEVDRYRLGKRPEKKHVGPQKIGFIGQLIPRKNVGDILDVFDRLHQVIPGLELQLLGDGESKQELEVQARALQSHQQIHFLGFRHDRMDFLKKFDLFVMASRDEGIPRCLMEAMAMGIPVSAYDIPGVDQLVEHGKTGLLAKFGDRESLLSHWQALLTDRETANRLAENARSFVQDKFSGKRMAWEYLNLFNSMLGRESKLL